MATSSAATLTVQSIGPVTGQPQSVSVSEGTAGVFTATAAGSPAPSVQWQVSGDGGNTWANDTTDSGATTGTLTVGATVLAESANQYRAVFTNPAGASTLQRRR